MSPRRPPCDLIVVGAGVTGCAIARDAALRGLSVTVLEQGTLGSGTSGRFHGMNQSGARYVTTDLEYAAQCMRERRIFERIAPHAMDDTGGLFVQLPEDPLEFGDEFEPACAEADIPCRRLSAQEIAAREPGLVPVVGGYEVPDAVFRPWAVLTALAEDGVAHGAEFCLRERVTRLDSDGEQCEVSVQSAHGGTEQLRARSIALAAGPWTTTLTPEGGQRAPMQLAKGSMLIISERVVTAVVNRCRPPGSFDIMVPFGAATIFGTTSRDVDSPEAIRVDADEESALLAIAGELVTDLPAEWTQTASVYAGVRPLAITAPGADGAVSRRHVIVQDHERPILTVAGGSFTTHRAMAEDAVDRICRLLDIDAVCTTATATLPPARGRFEWSGKAALQPVVMGASENLVAWGS
jgi:glycerol-3-phosphate dehydrogenase